MSHIENFLIACDESERGGFLLGPAITLYQQWGEMYVGMSVVLLTCMQYDADSGKRGNVPREGVLARARSNALLRNEGETRAKHENRATAGLGLQCRTG